MCNQSTQEITSIAINAAIGGNKSLFQRALENLKNKQPDELTQGIVSIIFGLEQNKVNGFFAKTAKQIFNTL